jgi:hypothetical protein
VNLYLLRRTDRIGYDELAGVVVAAYSEKAARSLAADANCDEGAAIWSEPSTTVELIGRAVPGLPSRIVLRDFNAG